MIKYALLWYELYVSVLKDIGFQLNPYDMCVANMDININQCTVAWYVDVNKVSYVKQGVIYDVINKVEWRFLGLTVTKGNVHIFLGIKISYLKNRRISIHMKEYIKEAVQEFRNDISQVVMSPVSRCMLTVVKVRKLQFKRLDTFHYDVMKLLWILHRGRPYVATAISFLFAIMNHLGVEYCKKLNRLL